jgi:1,4-dihydroxy-6-naphthoate synthase
MAANNDVISLGFSPCPNDCFIFDAMVHGKVDTEGLRFNVVMEDVEALNKRAFSKNEMLSVTKLSFAAYLQATQKYVLLNAGSALGFGVGPLLIAKKKIELSPASKIAIPGKLTTANFLFSAAFPQLKNKIEMLFSEIEKAVADGTADAGVIIHENRFTYSEKGLHKLIDLGEYWEQTTASPIPLGGIVAQRNLPDELIQKINRVIKRSVIFAFDNPKAPIDFVKAHAQEMSEEVMYKHIDLYVNKFSIDLGEIGKAAVNTLFANAYKAGLVKSVSTDIFAH